MNRRPVSSPFASECWYRQKRQCRVRAALRVMKVAKFDFPLSKL